MRLLRLAAAALMTIALAASAPAARAGDIDLSWDACVPTGGTPIAHRLAGAPGPYAFTLNGRNLAGQVRWTQFVFELRSPNGLPDAWRFDAVGCNAGGIQFETSSGSKACPAIGGLPSTSLSYALDPSGRAATLTVGALYGSSTELVATKNYLLGRILLDFSGATTTGAGSGCEGIDAPVCITLVEATVQRAGVAGPESLLPGQPFLTWNDPDGLTACSGRSLQGIRVEEFMTACATFVPGSQFLELMPPAAGTTLPGELRLRTEDAGGAVLADVDAIPAERVGEPWAAGGSWLVGTEIFTQSANLAADRSLPLFLSTGSGRIVLYDARPGGAVLQDLRYGGAEPVAAPAPGGSMVLSSGVYQAAATPMPHNFLGESTAGIECPFPEDPGPTSAPFAIRQVGYSCLSGSSAGQFVEIVSLSDSAWSGHLLIEVLNEQGDRLVARNQLFGSGGGTIHPGIGSCVVATSGFQPATGLSPDHVWAGFTPSGRTTFRLYSSAGGTIDQVSIGSGGLAPVPPPGSSVRFPPDTAFVPQFPPDPRNRAGALLPVSACFPADSSWTDDYSLVRFSELSTRCDYTDEGAQFLELRADGAGQQFDSHAVIEIFAVNGALTATLTGLFGAHPDGSAWPAGQTWLLAKDDFPAAAGFSADGSCPRLDPAGGRVRLYDSRLPSRTIDEIPYGPGTVLHSLPPRQSIQRDLDGTLSVRAPLSPTNSMGETTDSLTCPDPFGRLRISEVSTRCEDGYETGQFLELRAEGPGQEFGSHAAIEVFDGTGTRTAAWTSLFGAIPNGTAWIEGQTWLLASADFEPAAGFPADGSSPRLDLAGGRIRLYDTRLPQRTIDEVAYGTGTPLPAPAGGQSIQRSVDGTRTVTAPVSPTRSSGQTTSSVSCPCPPAVHSWGGPSYAATYDSTFFARRIRFNRLQPSISLRCYGSSAGVTLPDRFVVVGEPVGQEVEIIGLFRVDGYGGGRCAPVHGCAGGSASLTWSSPDSSGAHGPWSIAHHQILVTVRVRIGEPFPFSWRLAADTHTNGSYPGEADFTATFEWANLPPGTHMESCMGYFDETPVATLPTLLHSAAEPDRVSLQWSAPDDAASVEIERRTEDSEWLRLTTVPSSPREPITFEDRDVVPGGRYAYRIAWRNARGEIERSAETWVDVPGAVFAARLLDGTLARAPFDLALSLPNRETVRAELYDLRGRRLAAQTWAPEQAGPTEVRFAPGRALAPGVYWIRVVQGLERATLRAVVVASSR